MTVIPFAPYRPDVSHLNSEYSADTKNALLGAGFLIPVPALVSFTQAVDAQPLGGIAVRIDGLVHIFVGTAGTLWKYDASTTGWTPVSEPGADQITNGVFGADTDWTKDANWTISAGEAHATAVANGDGLSQAQSITAGIIYKLVFDVSNFSAGAVLPMFTGGTQVDGTAVAADGTHTQYLTGVTGNNAIEFQAVGTTTLDIDNVTLEPLTAYGATVAERWRFRQFGNFVVAVNINDDPQVYEVGTSTEFADLGGTPPNARNLAVWGDRLALFEGNSVHWCDTDDITEWTTGTAGSQTFPDGGEVMASTDETNPIIVQQRAIRAGTFVPGSLDAYSFTKIHTDKGCISPYAFASRGNLAFFADAGAFWQIDGAGQITPIGFEKVDRTFFGLVAGASEDTVYCEVDPLFQRAYFAVKITSTGDEFDQLLVYDWQIGEWTRLEMGLGILFPLAAGTTGLSLDDDAEGDVDLDNDFGDISLDSAIYEGGAPLMAAFTTDFKMGFFNGENLEARITTSEKGDTFARRATSTGAVAVVDTTGMSLEVGARDSRGSSVTYSAPVTQNSATDRFDFFESKRFQRFRLTIPAAAVWSAAQGVDVETQAAGEW